MLSWAYDLASDVMEKKGPGPIYGSSLVRPFSAIFGLFLRLLAIILHKNQKRTRFKDPLLMVFITPGPGFRLSAENRTRSLFYL